MTPIRLAAAFVFFLLSNPGASFSMPVADAPAKSRFTLFDGTKYSHKPDFKPHGMQVVHIAYEPNIFRDSSRQSRPADAMPVDELLQREAETARKMRSEYLVIDIEAWPMARSRRYPVEAARNLERHLSVMEQVRRIAPDLKIGLFSVLPVYTGYERLIAPQASALHAEMVEDNDKLLQLAKLVDAMFPIGYTMTEDRDEWLVALLKQVSEARRLNPRVPVYVFLWPEYADYAPAPAQLKGRWIQRDYWRYQLESVYQAADGAVIWGGWDSAGHRPQRWDDAAAWWDETKKFLRDKGLSKVPKPPNVKALEPAR